MGLVKPGRYEPLGLVRFNGATPVTVVNPLGGFGEVLTAQLTPRFQYGSYYNISPNIFRPATVVGTGATAIDASRLKVSTGTTTGSSATLETQSVLQYRSGMGGRIRFTAVWETEPPADGHALIGILSDEDGYAVGYYNGKFGFMHRVRGAVDSFQPISGWIDALDGSGDTGTNASGMQINTTKGNIFEIVYQYLGYGIATLSVANPNTGLFMPVAKTNYINQNTASNLGNPTMPFRIEVNNGSSTDDISIINASVAAFVDGVTNGTGIHWGKANSIAGVTTTPTNILTIRSKATFAGVTNRIPTHMELIDVAVDGTKPVIIRVRKNATNSGAAASWTDIDIDSPIEYDTTGVWTSGRVIAELPVSKDGSITLDIHDYGIHLSSGDTLTIEAEATSGSTDVVTSIIFKDER